MILGFPNCRFRGVGEIVQSGTVTAELLHTTSINYPTLSSLTSQSLTLILTLYTLSITFLHPFTWSDFSSPYSVFSDRLSLSRTSLILLWNFCKPFTHTFSFTACNHFQTYSLKTNYYKPYLSYKFTYISQKSDSAFRGKLINQIRK